MTGRNIFNKPAWQAAWVAAWTITLAPPVFGQVQTTDVPKVFAIISPDVPSTNAARTLVSISSDETKEITGLSGHVLYGMDEGTLAFLQTPANDSRSGSRLLVINRKTGAIITDRTVEEPGHPDTMKAITVERLAVRSKESAVYIPLFDGQRWNSFDVAEANWQTGDTRELSLPAAQGSERWEITALDAVPPGIAVERGPFLTIFDPANQTPLLTLTNIGPGSRPTWGYYAVPSYGILVSSNGIFKRITEKDFLTPAMISAEFPSRELGRDRNYRRDAEIIKGRPCLIWGEDEGVPVPNSTPMRTISEIVVYDLEAKQIMLRKPLGGNFSGRFLTDSTGQNIYLFNTRETEIFQLNLESQIIKSFAKPGTNYLDGVAAN